MRTKQQGFSLLELMVALALGLFLSAGVVQVYLASKTSYRLDDTLSRLQENGRYVLNLLSQEIRMSGYLGCESRGDVVWTNHVSGYTYDPTGSGMQGFEGKTDASADVSGWDLKSEYESGSLIKVLNSDVLRVMYGSSDAVDLGDSMADKSAPVTAANAYPRLAADDVALVTDCLFGDVFEVQTASIGDTVFQPKTDLNIRYARPGLLMEVETTNYFVGQQASNTQSTLYRRKFTETSAQPLIEGVEDLQIRYGLDTDGDDYADIYVTADGDADIPPDGTADVATPIWADVASVNICLLMASTDDNVLDTATSISGCEGATSNSDKRLRHVYTATVTLRNQLL